MLKTLNIKNFKSVHDLEIDLGRVNVFIGENGCGKTSILEAIGIGSAALTSKLDYEFLSSRGIRITDPRLMKSAFDNETPKQNINIKFVNADNDYIDYDIDYKNKGIYLSDFKSNITTVLSSEKFNEFLNHILSEQKVQKKLKDSVRKENEKVDKKKSQNKFDETHKLFLNELINHYSKDIYLQTDFVNSHNSQYAEKFNIAHFLTYTPENYFLRRFEEEGQIKPIGVRGEGLFSHLVEMFKNEDNNFYNELCKNLKLINWFDGLEIPSDLSFTEKRLNIKDRFLRESIEYFDQRSANEGFLYLLFYFTLFLSTDTPECFAIDNVDNALNPKLCKELIERIVILAKEKKKQVILTTHNPSILDGLDLTDDDQRLFVIYRNANGHTKAKRVNPPKKLDDIDTVRLSEAFIRGYIGGLPKNF